MSTIPNSEIDYPISEKTTHSPAKITLDEKFPVAGGEEVPLKTLDSGLFQVNDESDTEVLQHTESMGRAGYHLITHQIGENVFHVLFIKGTGVYKKFKDFGVRIAPSSHKSRVNFGTEIFGTSSREDQYLDAQKSLLLNDMGFACRIPLVGGYLKTMYTEDGEEDIEKLIKEGKISEAERPYISMWSMETPFRLSELSTKIRRDENELRAFLIEATKFTRYIKRENVMNFSQKIFQKIESNGSTAELLYLWLDFISSSLLEVKNKIEKNKIKHNNLHVQNISLHGELCDNSEITFDDSMTITDEMRKASDSLFDVLDKLREIGDDKILNLQELEAKLVKIGNY